MAKATKSPFAAQHDETPLAPSLRSAPTREYEPTPFDDIIQNAAAGDTFRVPNVHEVPADDKGRSGAEQAVSLLNRAARHAGRYLRVRYLDADGMPVKRGSVEITTIQFQVSDEPAREVRFTADQIRVWAAENGLPATGGGKTGKAIPAETRAAFWSAVEEMDAEQETSLVAVNA